MSLQIIGRHGNKWRLAEQICASFLPHNTFIDMFFGCGGIFFNKPLARYNVINDIDRGVMNLYEVVKSDGERLEYEFSLMPICEELFLKQKALQTDDPLQKALRSLYLYHYSIFQKSVSFDKTANVCSGKKTTLNRFEALLKSDYLLKTSIFCESFRNLLNKMSFDKDGEGASKSKSFIYADPPYVDTNCKQYKHIKGQWTAEDTSDVFEVCVNSGIRFAISERDTPFIRDLAKKHNLECVKLDTSNTIRPLSGSKREEILIVNYDVNKQQVLI